MSSLSKNRNALRGVLDKSRKKKELKNKENTLTDLHLRLKAYQMSDSGIKKQKIARELGITVFILNKYLELGPPTQQEIDETTYEYQILLEDFQNSGQGSQDDVPERKSSKKHKKKSKKEETDESEDEEEEKKKKSKKHKKKSKKEETSEEETSEEEESEEEPKVIENSVTLQGQNSAVENLIKNLKNASLDEQQQFFKLLQQNNLLN